MKANTTSPASSGPAGSHFEGQVGAHYLLSMVTGTDPRGLPGTTIDRIKLQRTAEGRPLDDVIVTPIIPAAIPQFLRSRSSGASHLRTVTRYFAQSLVRSSRPPEDQTSGSAATNSRLRLPERLGRLTVPTRMS